MAKKQRASSRKKSARREGGKNFFVQTTTDIWEKIPSKYQHFLVLFFLLIVPSFIFSEVYFGGQQFVAHDIQQWRAASQSVIEYQEETGEDALWATNIFSGMPSYTVISNKAFFHIDTLLRRVFSAWFIPVFPFTICAGGVYFFFWLMGFRPLQAALGTLVICLTTYITIIVGAGHNSKLITWSYIPWVMAGYQMLSRSPHRLAGFFLFAIALNFTLRGEHIQVLYYFLFVLAIWFIYDGVAAWRGQILTDWSKRAALMVVAGLLALSANIQPYWSIYEYSDYSIRGGSELQEGGDDGLSIDYAFTWSQGRAELLTLIIPDLFGGSSVDGTYWGPKPFTSGPHYLGAIAFLMFLIGLIHASGRLKFVFLGSGLLALFFSLGSNLYSFNYLFFHYIPFFNKFRTPEMWLIVTVFCFSVISVMGMKWIYDSWKTGTLSLSPLWMPLGISLVVALFFTGFSGSILSFEKPGEREQFAQQLATQNQMDPGDPQIQQSVSRYIDQEIKPERIQKAFSDSRRLFIFLLLGGGLLIGTALRKIPANYTLAALVMLAAIDMVQIGNRYVDKSGLIPASTSSRDAVARQVRSIDRYIADNIRGDETWPYRSFPLGDNPFNNAVPAAFVYPSIGGYSGAKLSNYQDVINHAIYNGPAGLNTEVLNMLNTRYLTYPGPVQLPGWNVVYQDDGGVVMENRNVLPKAWFVDSLITATNAQQAVDELNRFDASSTAILQGNIHKPDITPSNNRDVEITAYGPREIRADITTDAPSFLVLSEIYYPPGWKATLNDEPVDIHRTNYILRGFSIPEGEHQLKLRFDPRSHILGSRLSLLFNTLIMLIGVIAFIVYYREKRPGEKENESRSRKDKDPLTGTDPS
ncbi:MAG: YfhO family protein [Balneolales bacterium]